jgi:hypothetical protein
LCPSLGNSLYIRQLYDLHFFHTFMDWKLLTVITELVYCGDCIDSVATVVNTVVIFITLKILTNALVTFNASAPSLAADSFKKSIAFCCMKVI